MRQAKGEKAIPAARQRVYWDAWLIIAWIKDEKHPGVEEQVRKLHAREILAYTSTLTLVEVLECTIPADRRILLQSLTRMPDKLVVVQVGPKEAERAHEIRNRFKEPDPDNAKTVSTQDAIHLATATLNECEVFYTEDGTTRRSRRCLKLIPLSGDGAVYGLRIGSPPPPEPAPVAPQMALLDPAEQGAGE